LEKKGVGRHFFPISTTILFEIETELYYVVNRGYESIIHLYKVTPPKPYATFPGMVTLPNYV
jgi:hypothetical protein